MTSLEGLVRHCVLALILMKMTLAMGIASEVGRLRIHVVDFRGTPVAGARVELKGRQNHQFRKILPKLDQLVPYGDYEITVSRDGYTTRRREVTIDSADCWVTMGLSSQTSQLIRVEGKVRPAIDAVSPAWVRLIPVYSEQILTQPLTESGEFSFADVLPGKYFLVVLQEERKVIGLSEVILSKNLETVVIPTVSDKRRPIQ